MNEQQFELLHEELSRLCGAPEDEVFVFNGIRFQLIHAQDDQAAWLDLVAEVMKLEETDTIAAMSMALAMNFSLLRESSNPSWFAMTGEDHPAIALVQRFYGTLYLQDVLWYLNALEQRCGELRSAIGEMVVEA
jgi:hypothetical protein